MQDIILLFPRQEDYLLSHNSSNLNRHEWAKVIQKLAPLSETLEFYAPSFYEEAFQKGCQIVQEKIFKGVANTPTFSSLLCIVCANFGHLDLAIQVAKDSSFDDEQIGLIFRILLAYSEYHPTGLITVIQTALEELPGNYPCLLLQAVIGQNFKESWLYMTEEQFQEIKDFIEEKKKKLSSAIDRDTMTQIIFIFNHAASAVPAKIISCR